MNENLPIRWDEELAKSAKEVSSLERPAVSQISTRAGVMTYQKVPVPGNKMECIIVASAFENKYFGSRKFDPNNYTAPLCYALSSNGLEMVPHQDSEDRQAESCDRCDNMKWGSAGNGSKGKACKEVRRLALIPKDSLDKGVSSAEIAVLSLPVTSVKNWASYVNGIAVEYSRPPWAVITEVGLSPDPRSQFQVWFKTKGLIEDEHLSALHKKISPALDILLTPYDASGVVAQAPDPLPNRKY